jgi:hypothetical protein
LLVSAFVERSSYKCLFANRPILTYGRQGTSKLGVKPEHHAILYTATNNTHKPPSELPGEHMLPNTPIRIEPLTPRHILDSTSRLNYAKTYTVEHNVKVCFIGKVHKNSRTAFIDDYRKIHDVMRDKDSDMDSDNPAPSDYDNSAFKDGDDTARKDVNEKDLRSLNLEYRY